MRRLPAAIVVAIAITPITSAVPGGGDDEGASHLCIEHGTQPPVHTCISLVHTTDTSDCYNRPPWPICPTVFSPPSECVEEWGIDVCTPSQRIDQGIGFGCRRAFQNCQKGGKVECFGDDYDPDHMIVAGNGGISCLVAGSGVQKSCKNR